jgi:hypothetical protein
VATDQARPPLTVVLPLREGWTAELDPLADALMPQARRAGAEVLAVGPIDDPGIEGVRVLRIDDDNIYRLRLLGLQAARGDVVAIGEDHAVPRPGWCEAVIHAHAEHPGAAAVVGCLHNATRATVAGRANFLAFAALCAPPEPDLHRPPPASALSFKRAALAGLDGRLGRFEAEVIPELFESGEMAVDARVVVDHHQDHGVLWSVINAFHSARASYGYAARGARRERLRVARWSVANWPVRLVREARRAAAREARGAIDFVAVAAIAVAAGLGGAVGLLAGPGRSPSRVA